MYLLPGSLLAMYRASASTFYENDINGNMYLYNDSLYLSEQLRSFLKHHQSRNSSTQAYLKVESDIQTLEIFGKRAYGKDMESKRTTLVDLIDGAQGFTSCTQEPFAQQCDLAISSTIDFIRQIHRRWSTVLSRSALLQSIGSLLTTVTNKIIVDIEDMGDISEPESQRLVSFCKSITTLEDLFMPENWESLPEEQQVPLTAVYTSTWLRFQYLSNILDSSLADIKYLWTDAELSREFAVNEVVDLIEALFADSEHRRRAIAEIRRGV
jgi:protein transport protein DSL1/ZW10